jgi:hypothetical protein
MTVQDMWIPTQNDPGEALVDPVVQMAELMVGPIDIAQVARHVVTICADLPAVDGAALLLAGEALTLSTAARTGAVFGQDSTVRLPRHGPTEEVLRTGGGCGVRVVSAGERWPQWAQVMTELGIARVTWLPLTLVGRVVGGLELYSRDDRALPPSTRRLARGLCALTCVALLHDHELTARAEQVRQLSDALQRRVAVEQAKGYLCAQGFADPEGAFHVLRQYARHARRSVDAVARDVVTGRLGAESLVAASRPPA